MEPKHPSGDVLKLYSLDLLNKSEKAHVEEHLVICAECRNHVSSLAGTTESTAVAQCRLLFMRAATHHPQIRLADSLRAKVLIPTEELWIELGLPVPNLPASQWEPVQRTALETWDREHAKLLYNWATDLNLQYDWVLSEATAQLTTWRSLPKAKGAFTIILGYLAPQFYIEPWHFDNEMEVPYRRRIKAKFGAALEAHISEVKQLRSRLLPDRGSQSSHYRWAAEHVCLKWKWGEIARKNGAYVTWQAVGKAVRPILTKIGIPESTT